MTEAPEQPIERAVCVYCASSRTAHPEYRAAARRLGEVLAGEGVGIVYGGGAAGSMGALADGALSKGGRVVGILPRFMADLEWGHKGLSDLQLVEDLRTRKHMMLTLSQAAIALPGGSGTLEELLEAITLKRLGLYLNPIVMVNTRGFFAPLLELLTHAIEERFMDPRHRLMWQVVATPEEVPAALADAPAWTAQARSSTSAWPPGSKPRRSALSQSARPASKWCTLGKQSLLPKYNTGERAVRAERTLRSTRSSMWCRAGATDTRTNQMTTKGDRE